MIIFLLIGVEKIHICWFTSSRSNSFNMATCLALINISANVYRYISAYVVIAPLIPCWVSNRSFFADYGTTRETPITGLITKRRNTTSIIFSEFSGFLDEIYYRALTSKYLDMLYQPYTVSDIMCEVPHFGVKRWSSAYSVNNYLSFFLISGPGLRASKWTSNFSVSLQPINEIWTEVPYCFYPRRLSFFSAQFALQVAVDKKIIN